jgi:outer membrane protein assembly factor BamB
VVFLCYLSNLWAEATTNATTNATTETKTEATTGSSWPMLFHDLNHTSSSNSISGPNASTAHVLWSIEMSEMYTPCSSCFSVPGVVISSTNSIIVASGCDYTIRSYTFDGILEWSFNTQNSVCNTPGIDEEDNNSIVFIDVFNTIIKISSTGTFIWKTSLNASYFITSSPMFYESTIYIGNFALHSKTGEILWKAILPPNSTFLIATVAISYNGTVFMAISGNAGGVYAINATSGQVLWSALTSQYVLLSSPLLANVGILILGISSSDQKYGTIVGLSLIDPDHPVVWLVYSDSGLVATPSISSTSSTSSIVSVGSYNGTLYSVDPLLGTLQWTSSEGAAITASVCSDVNNVVYILTANGVLLARNGTNGNLFWNLSYTFPIENTIITSSPVINARGDILFTVLETNRNGKTSHTLFSIGN